jgi:hypothetical protein
MLGRFDTEKEAKAEFDNFKTFMIEQSTVNAGA